jgi:hypothetical protein
VNEFDLFIPAWERMHTASKLYLGDLGYVDEAPAWGAQACGYWLRAVLDGFDAPFGPYANLYAATVFVARRKAGMSFAWSAAQCEDLVPLSDFQLAYDLCRLASEAWKAGQLAGWDRSSINIVSRSLGYLIPEGKDGRFSCAQEMIKGHGYFTARRALEVVHEHTCAKCLICAAAAHRWDADDQATEVWLTGQRLAREGI